MWSTIIGLCFIFISAYASHWILWRWRNPKCSGILPPGSSGLPLIGESIQLMKPSNSLGTPPLINHRIKKYGSLFRTNIAGRHLIISTDPLVNSYIFQQEGKLVELWYLDSFENIINLNSSSHNDIHKYLRGIIKRQFGIDSLKQNLLYQFQQLASRTFQLWSTQDSIQVKFESNKVQRSFLDVMLAKQNGWQKNLSENPTVLRHLKDEHEKTIEQREDKNTSVTWDEYKSMTFTLQVIKETLRMGTTLPGVFRKAKKDFLLNGYTIPKGWVIIAAYIHTHYDPTLFKDPYEFNPWRWKVIESDALKYFNPFGGGIRQCVGAEYAKAILAIFIHVMVTKYRWEKVGGGEIVQAPIIQFKNDLCIKVTVKP